VRLATRVILGAFLLLALLLVLNKVLEDSVTKDAKADTGQVLDLPGGDLQVREDGDRSASAIVLIHGWTASMHWWDRLVPKLRARRIVRVDLLGHGGSEKPKNGYSMEDQADRIATALRLLRVRRATVVGHSTGGEVAIALAARHPEFVRRLVVMDTEADEDDVDTDLSTKLSLTPFVGEAFWRVGTDGQIEDGLKQAFASDDFPVPDQFVRDFRKLTYTSFKKTSNESGDYVDDGHLARDYRRIRAPTMVVYGRGDRLVDPASAQKLSSLRASRVVLIDGAGHSAMVERPDELARVLLRFDGAGAARRR
jgi:pimeloyl-ACP methyl ester carboxylesterase